jgi:hypothetical protein
MGGGGGRSPPTLERGGADPPNTHINTIIIHDSLQLVGSKNDLATECLRNVLRESKFPKFSDVLTFPLRGNGVD